MIRRLWSARVPLPLAVAALVVTLGGAAGGSTLHHRHPAPVRVVLTPAADSCPAYAGGLEIHPASATEGGQ